MKALPHLPLKTPLQISSVPSPTWTLDVLAKAATQRLQEEFPGWLRWPQLMFDWLREVHLGLMALMTETLKEIGDMENKIRHRLYNRYHRRLKKSRNPRQDAMTDLHTLRLWRQLRLLQGLYRTQQRMVHCLPTPIDPLPVVQLLTPEHWKD